MKTKKIIGLCIIIGLALSGLIASLFLILTSDSKETLNTISSIFGIIATAASVVLSIVSMIYANNSSKKAEESLVKVNNHYEAFYQKIASGLIADNLGKKGAENLIARTEKKTTKK